jgi:hypothetical protein
MVILTLAVQILQYVGNPYHKFQTIYSQIIKLNCQKKLTFNWVRLASEMSENILAAIVIWEAGIEPTALGRAN